MTTNAVTPWFPPLFTSADYWATGLRFPEHDEVMRLSTDSEDFRSELARVVGNKVVARVACRALNVCEDGTLAQIRERIAEHRMVKYLLLAVRFGRQVRNDAIADVVRGVLSDDDRALCCPLNKQDEPGEPDRSAALMLLYWREPQNLVYVRALDLWHRSGSATYRLGGPLGLLPKQPMQDFFLTDPRFRGLLSEAGVGFEGLFPYGNGSWLLFLRRDFKRTWLRNAEGEVVHGFDEELVVLHFREGGRVVRVSAKSDAPPRELAGRIASVFFDTPCTYERDLATTHEVHVRALLAAILNPFDDDLELVKMSSYTVGALEIGPTVTLEGSRGARIETAVAAFEARVGPMLPDPDRARVLVVKHDGRSFALRIWRMRNQELVVQFGDAHASNRHAAAFRRHLESRYNVQVRSTRTSGSRWC